MDSLPMESAHDADENNTNRLRQSVGTTIKLMPILYAAFISVIFVLSQREAQHYKEGMSAIRQKLDEKINSDPRLHQFKDSPLLDEMITVFNDVAEDIDDKELQPIAQDE
tara:strand:- start:1492 stop:1821 length:330 start_codon:yes stop_codon:yes gene_type:complete